MGKCGNENYRPFTHEEKIIMEIRKTINKKVI